MRVLAIGVHPDDIEFGMGATLAKHIKLGHEISAVILTDGKRDEFGKYTKCIERREESEKALKILGYEKEVNFLNLPKVSVSQSTIHILEKIIDEFKPTRIYTHSRNDRHQDHRKCSYAVLSAGRYISEILLYEIYSSLPDFVPNYLICFSKELLELKIRANSEFKSQFKNMELIAKMIEGMAIKNSFITYATQRQEIQYTEAFEIAKIVKPLNEI
jgi:LmbE family N-acetylglucosaminyl deacetylase